MFVTLSQKIKKLEKKVIERLNFVLILNRLWSMLIELRGINKKEIVI